MRKNKGATARRSGTWYLRPATGAYLTRLARVVGVERRHGEKDLALQRRIIREAFYDLLHSVEGL